MATRHPDGPVDEAGPVVRRRRDRSDRLDQDLGAGAVAANVSPARYQRRVNSETLMGGERTLVIQHQGEEYTLRLTRLGKLLLTK